MAIGVISGKGFAGFQHPKFENVHIPLNFVKIFQKL